MNIAKEPTMRQVWDSVSFEILDDGYAVLGTEWAYLYVRPLHSRLYYITDGGAWVEWQGRRTELTAGRVYLIPAGLTVRCGCPEAMTQLYFHIIARTRDGYDFFSCCGRVLELEPAADVRTMAEDYRSGELKRCAMLRAAVETDLWRMIVAGGLEEQLPNRHSAFLERVFDVVRERLCSSLRIGDVAEAMSVSESTLTKRFRAEFGVTLGRYIDDMLLQEICRMLTATEMSVGEIAERLGFCDQFYLSRFFRQHQDKTPSRYRADMRGRS